MRSRGCPGRGSSGSGPRPRTLVDAEELRPSSGRGGPRGRSRPIECLSIVRQVENSVIRHQSMVGSSPRLCSAVGWVWHCLHAAAPRNWPSWTSAATSPISPWPRAIAGRAIAAAATSGITRTCRRLFRIDRLVLLVSSAAELPLDQPESVGGRHGPVSGRGVRVRGRKLRPADHRLQGGRSRRVRRGRGPGRPAPPRGPPRPGTPGRSRPRSGPRPGPCRRARARRSRRVASARRFSVIDDLPSSRSVVDRVERSPLDRRPSARRVRRRRPAARSRICSGSGYGVRTRGRGRRASRRADRCPGR